MQVYKKPQPTCQHNRTPSSLVRLTCELIAKRPLTPPKVRSTANYSNWDEIPRELIKDEKSRAMRNSHVGIHIQEYKIAENLTVRPI